MRRLPSFLRVALSLCAIVTGRRAIADTQLDAILVASGLFNPVFVASPAGDLDRLFIVETTGSIKILKNGTVLPTPFLYIGPQIAILGEKGLLGFAFHPRYATNGWFYVYYTRAGDGAIVVARYTVSAGDPDRADPASAVTIFGPVAHPLPNHYAGCIQFGPDGYLYIALGDGGGAGDPACNAQNGAVLHGKLLRIDVDGGFPYVIPPSNPFVNDPAFRDEIWAYGLRNPWRFSFDRETGDLYLGDVGQDSMEEVNFQAAGTKGGVNFGWKIMEGSTCFGASACAPGVPACNSPRLEPPIWEFPHSVGCAIAGGYVYRGCAMPDLQGTYFCAEYCTPRIFSFRYDGTNLTDFTDRTAELAPSGAVIHSIVSFGEDARGEPYICDLEGWIFKIVPRAPPCSLTVFGQATANSTGQIASIDALGPAELCENDLVLTCSRLPVNINGLFFAGTRRVPCAPFGNGFRCVGGDLFRLDAVSSGPTGTARYPVDLSEFPFDTIAPGDVRFFQFWYRDFAAGGANFNTSNALQVRFCE